MNPDAYPRIRAVDFLKRQPEYELMFFWYQGGRVILGVNDEAAAIVSTCDGRTSMSAIVERLAQRYGDTPDNVAPKVSRFLDRMTGLGLLTWESSPALSPVRVVGTTEYWTPEAVVLELTQRCPLSCVHCYAEAGKGPSMDYDALRKIMGHLVTDIGLRVVELTGGEPMLYSRLYEVVDYLMSNGVETHVATSGMVLNDQARRVLGRLASPQGLVQISVDGLQSTHNSIRGHPQAFGRAMRFMDCALGLHVQVDTATALIDQPESEIVRLCALLRDKGVRRARFGPVSRQGRAQQLTGREMWSADRARLLRADLQRRYNTDHFTVESLEDARDAPPWRTCGAGTRLLVIGPTLRVRPCPMMSLTVGDLRTDSLESILLTSNRLFAGMRPPEPDTCRDCPLESACHGCVAEGRINAARVPECPWAHASGLKPTHAGASPS